MQKVKSYWRITSVDCCQHCLPVSIRFYLKIKEMTCFFVFCGRKRLVCVRSLFRPRIVRHTHTHTTSLVHRLKHVLNAISCRLSFHCISSGKNELIIVICLGIFQIEFHNLKIFSIACSVMHVNCKCKIVSNLKFLQFNCSLFRFTSTLLLLLSLLSLS